MRKKCTVTLKKIKKDNFQRGVVNRVREKLEASGYTGRITDCTYIFRYDEESQPEIIDEMQQHALANDGLVKVKIEYSSASYFKKKQFDKIFGDS